MTITVNKIIRRYKISSKGAMRSRLKTYTRYFGVDDKEKKKVLGVLMVVF